MIPNGVPIQQQPGLVLKLMRVYHAQPSCNITMVSLQSSACTGAASTFMVKLIPEHCTKQPVTKQVPHDGYAQCCK